MVISANKNFKILTITGSILAIASIVTFTSFQQNTSAYSKYCVTATCRAAADKAEASSVAAAEASGKANDLQSKIDALNAEIAQKEAEIKENEAMRADIEKQIKDTEAKLERDKTAIRTLIKKVNTADGGNSPTAIDILASSESVSDVVEEGNRQTSVEERLTEAAKQVKQDKQELEEQKAAIQRTLDSNNAKKQEIAANRAEQAELKQKYENDAAGYQKAAAEAASVVAAETAKQQQEAQRYTGGGTAARISAGYGATGWWGVNTYPYAAQCPGINNAGGAFGGNYCQCAGYAGWKLYERYGFNIYRDSTLGRWGNAKYWGSSAQREGAHTFRVDDTPTAGSIGYSTAGTYGHVVWIESVNGDGTVNITEYNYNLVGDFGARKNVPASKFTGFIHY